MSSLPAPSSPAARDPDDVALSRAGSVPYLNVARLVRGLEGRLRLLPPSSLGRQLREGRLDAGLLSITEALLHDAYAVLDGPCVASDGPVYSVLLAHTAPLEHVRTVHCHAASLTSVNLLRVLLAERGLHPVFQPMENPADASSHEFVLLIGDPAIAFRRSPSGRRHVIWDLGEGWRDLTGLPFVYAAWVLRRDADTRRLRALLLQAAERGQRELDAVIRESTGFDEAFRREYLTQHVHNILGHREKAGIARFCELLRRHVTPQVHVPVYVR